MLREKMFFERFMRENIKQDRQRCIINTLSIDEPLDREKRLIVQSIYTFAFL